MKKIIITALAAAFVFVSCQNGGMETPPFIIPEPNPYPDGVYPFEVTGVSHTHFDDTFFRNFIITWTTPSNGFDYIQIELFQKHNLGEDILFSSTVNTDFLSGWYKDFVLTNDSFSFKAAFTNDLFVIIKCVDKFGNTSKGVKYEFSWDD